MTAFWIRLKHHWFRNLLAVLQVGLAIAAVSAVFIDVLPALKTESAETPSTFTVRFGARTDTGVMWSGAFLPDDVAYLLEHGDTVEAASTLDSQVQAVVRVGDERFVLPNMGRVHPSFERLMDLEVVAGSFFTERDRAGGSPRVAVISEDLARFLYGGSAAALGQSINVRPETERSLLLGFAPAEARAAALASPGEDVEIIGVFALPAPEGAGTSLIQQAVMLLPAADGGSVEFQSQSAEILVKAKPGMENLLEDEVKTLLGARLAERGDASREIDGVPLGILVEPAGAEGSLREARLFSGLIFGALGLAALVVSSIAMFTTTLANLTQRTRYIGLGRALGATRGRVVREVVAESALLAGLGGVVGVAASFPLRATVLAPLFGVLSDGHGIGVVDVLLAGLVGIGLAVAVGALAGLYPAWTVARLVPAEAWREGHV